MAKAKKMITAIMPPVQLELSADEAGALTSVLNKVGGSPDLSRRGLIENILLALVDEGYNHPFAADLEGGLVFKDIN